MTLRSVISSKLFWACALVAAVGVGAAGWLYGGHVVEALGLGVVPLALWVAAAAALGVSGRGWLRPWNVWLGSIAYLAAMFAVLGYFRPGEGPLTAFTSGVDASLGGTVGDFIRGDSAWLGGLRVLALVAAGTAIAGPRLSFDVLKLLGRAGVMFYVAIAMAGGAVASLFGRIYKSDRSDEAAAAANRRESEALRRALEAQQANANSFTYAGRGPAAETGLPAADDETADAAVPDPAMARVNGADEYSEADADPAVAQADASEEEYVEAAEPLAAQAVTVAEPATRDPDGEGPSDAPEPGPPAFDGPRLETILGVRPQSPPGSSARYNRFWNRSADEPPQEPPERNGHVVEPVEPAVAETIEPDPEPAQPGQRASWDLPDRGMVRNEDEGGISEEEMAHTSRTIQQTLAEYNIEVEIGQMKPGPAVTMYGLIPGWIRRYKQVKATDENGRPRLDEAGKAIVTRVETKTRVKVDSIISREKDLSLALKTPSIRIETPVLGESQVGIEVPNPSLSVVTLGRLMESPEYKKLLGKAKLPIVLGKGTGGEAVVVDLAAMPHLLVAGATGAGKSVCINAIVSCLLMEKTPQDLRLLMVDPKRVELTPYNGIPHLATPVVVESDQVVPLLKGLIREMFNRYRKMEEVGARNIDSYNRRQPDKMPYIVLAVDELADLMMTSSFEVEQALCRLAQLGRATGIHLIIATQRPSVDVVTGLIKANFPTRISFGVSSQIDSRTILDTAGAEKLLGRGDMLYLAVDASRPKRVQGVFISDEECEGIVDFWQTTPRGPIPEVSLHAVGDEEESDEEEKGADPDRDEMLQKAIDLAQTQKKLSTSLLQRRLRIGYPRAARLMDQLEDEGVVGPGDGSKSRDVIMNEA